MPSNDEFRLFAHRGDNRNFTENTLAAFQSSVKAGFLAMELDLVRLRDGNVVVFHDDDLNRICGIDRSVYEIPLDDFKNAFPDLLTAEEFVLHFKDLDLEINLEIKDDIKTLETILPLTKKLRKPLISSFNSDVVDEAVEKGLPSAYLFSNLYSFLKRKLFLKNRRLHISSRMVLKNPLSRLFFRHYQVYCYTVNDPEEVKRLRAYPFIKGIFTDRVEMIMEV